MTASELFGVIVRFLGLLCLVYAFLIAVRLMVPIEGLNRWEYFQNVAAIGGLGLVCFFGADSIVRATYRTVAVKSSADT